MHDVVVRSNIALMYAGAVIGSCPDFDLADCDFIGNAATSSTHGALTVLNCSGTLRTHARPAIMAGNYAQGGGALIIQSLGALNISAPVYPLLVISNSATSVGGALWVGDYATATVAGAVHFTGNSAVLGGAIMASNHAVLTLIPTNGLAPLFIGNAAVNNGGAINLMATSRVHAVNCTFRENTAGSFGGAIRNMQSYLHIVPDFAQAAGAPPSLLANNTAVYGGAIHSYQAPQTLLDSALLISNMATSGGGGVRMLSASPVQLINCVITHNSSPSGGGAAIDATSSAQLRHCTVVENASDGVVSAGGPIALSNCIVWANTPAQVTAGYTVRFSDIEGGYPGAGNLDVNPAFVNTAAMNYALLYYSQCIDAGTPAGVLWDCTGKPRPMGLGYDMGAYELDPAPVQSVTPLLDFGDVIVGDTSNMPARVDNLGYSTLNGTVNFVPIPIFTAAPASYSVPPLDATDVTITFAPPTEYYWTQTVVFASNGGTQSVVLVGTGIPEPCLMFLIGLIGVIRPIRRIIAAH